MNRSIAAFALCVILTTGANATHEPVHLWSRSAGATGVDRGYSVAIDSEGNAVHVGHFSGSVDLGGGALASSGLYDAFVAKYDYLGNHLWSKRFGGIVNDVAYAMTIDESGDILITGAFDDTVDFGGGAFVGAGITDIFLLKLDTDGNHIWSQRIGGVGADGALGLAVDTAGEIVVAGYLSDTVDLAGNNLVSAGSTDIFLAKFSSDGLPLWWQLMGSTSSEHAKAVAIDAAGNIALTGYYSLSVDFGGGALASNGTQDGFLAKYDSDGAHLSSMNFGSTSTDAGNAVAFASDGSLLLSGQIQETVDVGGGPLLSAGGLDILVAKFDPSGAHVWSKSFGGTGSDWGSGIVSTELDRVVLTGLFHSSVDFGGGVLTAGGSRADVFALKLDTDGEHLWSKDYGSNSDAHGRSVAIGTAGDVYVTGSFRNSIDFGGGPLLGPPDDDIFLARLSDPSQPRIDSIADIGNDQGRRVKIRFARSGHDNADSPTPVLSYDIYRRNAPLPSKAAWTFVGSVPAHAESGYGIDVSTLADSTVVDGQFESVFYVKAATATPTFFFDSPPDSGYSLDNLAPSAPMGMKHAAGTLSWDGSTDTDFDHFNIYGSQTSLQLDATLVERTVDNSIEIVDLPFEYFFVSATDRAGNESASSTLRVGPDGTAAPARPALLLHAQPNPFNPNTVIQFSLPEAGPVTLSILDSRGRIVAALLEHETFPKGEHALPWHGQDTRGSTLASGIYFAQITLENQSKAIKIVLLK